MLAAGGVEDDAVLSVLLHMPFVDHLVQELRRDLALVGFILQQADSGSELLELFEFSRHLCLPSDLLLLVLFDLGLGASSLAAGLQEVGGDALRNYQKKNGIKMEDGNANLRLTLVLARKAAAISGSASMLRFLFSLTAELRSSMRFLTQPLKTPPRTVTQMLQIHSLETFLISCWSGMYAKTF